MNEQMTMIITEAVGNGNGLVKLTFHTGETAQINLNTRKGTIAFAALLLECKIYHIKNVEELIGATFLRSPNAPPLDRKN